MHCFTETWEMAKAALDLEFLYLVFRVSSPSRMPMRCAMWRRRGARRRILIETDSPYLAPVPFRGKPNEPRYVGKVAGGRRGGPRRQRRHRRAAVARNFYRLFRCRRPGPDLTTARPSHVHDRTAADAAHAGMPISTLLTAAGMVLACPIAWVWRQAALHVLHQAGWSVAALSPPTPPPAD